jgi:dihydroorotase
MSGSIAFINARVIDPASERDFHGGVLIEDGLIAQIDETVDTSSAEEIIDAQGRILAPALIDLRVAREPGLTPDGETLETLCRGAAAGGVGTMVLAPNSVTPNDRPESLPSAPHDTPVRVLTAAGATQGLQGHAMTELGLLARAGAVYAGCGDQPISDTRTMRRVLAYASHLDLWVAARPADAHLSADTVALESDWSARLGLPSEPGISERIAIERDASLAELPGGKFLIDRLSTSSGLDALRHVRQRDIELASTVAIAHLVLNEIDAGDLDGAFRMTPPLRAESDRMALVEAVANGEINAVVSDHRPTPFDDKGEPFALAVPGTLAIETMLGSLLGLVHDGQLELMDALQVVTSGPADILGLPQGRLSPGAPADLILIDGDVPWVCDPDEFASPRGNSAWAGRRFQGRVLQTIVGGCTIHNHNA